ncbi:MAG: tRNA (guanosine(46)-N7)-methyltransferase TrmB [Pseudomonadota bacterium]
MCTRATSTSGYITKLYGRRQGKGLKPRQSRLYDRLLPSIVATTPQSGERVDPKSCFPPNAVDEVWFEIGFGGGEHLAWQAARNPRVGVIGAEAFLDGVGKLLGQVDDMRLKNVRILHGDARPFLEAVSDGSLGRIFVLHPDPWPKKRHHKRRMISPWFFTEAARALRPGGILRVASDIPGYVAWTLMHARASPAFEWLAETADDWRARPDDWPQTRYEAKAMKEGRAPTYLQFRRKP